MNYDDQCQLDALQSINEGPAHVIVQMKQLMDEGRIEEVRAMLDEMVSEETVQ